MNPLYAISRKSQKLIIGLMSGTSTDGVDAALLRVKGNGLSTRFTLIACMTFPFHSSLRKKLWMLQDAPAISLEEFSRLHFVMGEVFASAALTLCRKCRISPALIDIIGSHGHTVAHYPGTKKFAGYTTGATCQIGDCNVIALRTGSITVGDFRTADVAVGGEGAPLVPYFDYLVFRSKQTSRGVLNIGGISNLTVLPKNCSLKDVFAFDCGPGNMMIDYLMNALYGKKMDKNGKTASSGNVSQTLLRWLLGHPFLKKSPPRSTGRETFGPGFAESVLAKSRSLNLSNADIIATVTQFTVLAIAHAYKKFVEPKTRLDDIIVSGGGIHNTFLIEALSRLLPRVKIESIAAHGISPDAKEAVAFAILANESIAGHPGNVPGATGAKKRVVLGKICLP